MMAADDYTKAMPDPVKGLTGTAQPDDDDKKTKKAGDKRIKAPTSTSVA
jgi:hypothetical protein